MFRIGVTLGLVIRIDKNPPTLAEALKQLFDAAEELASDTVVPNFVNPLATAIASRS